MTTPTQPILKQALTFQSLYYTYTTYTMKAIILQSTHFTYTTYDSQAILLQERTTPTQPIIRYTNK